MPLFRSIVIRITINKHLPHFGENYTTKKVDISDHIRNVDKREYLHQNKLEKSYGMAMYCKLTV